MLLSKIMKIPEPENYGERSEQENQLLRKEGDPASFAPELWVLTMEYRARLLIHFQIKLRENIGAHSLFVRDLK